MIFLTYNDAFSGIYKSQVADVCSFFEKELSIKTKLVAFISIRGFFSQRRLIKDTCPDSTVLPMFPKPQFWKMNIPMLFITCLFSGQNKIWARGPFACNMALSLKGMGLVKRVYFDARGAYHAELNEYDVVQNESVKRSIEGIERRALEKSDAQLAVSAKLVEWWKEHYQFVPKKYSVIPCTLSADFLLSFPDENEIKKLRHDLRFKESDIVLIYSGSSAGWQSFSLVDEFLHPLLAANENIRLVFLSNEKPKDSKTFRDHSNRIITHWVKPAEVRNMLLAADYGLLVRERTVTNKVASPVKFAEYLSCGLQVIISEAIGDLSAFVKEKNCGYAHTSLPALQKPGYHQKEKNYKLALENFSKNSAFVKSGYLYLLKD